MELNSFVDFLKEDLKNGVAGIENNLLVGNYPDHAQTVKHAGIRTGVQLVIEGLDAVLQNYLKAQDNKNPNNTLSDSTSGGDGN